MSLPAFAATPPVETSLSVGISNYREADVPRHLLVGGDNRRYDVDIRQFRLLAPIGRSWSVGLDLSRETMSGASPWGTVIGPDGEPALIMSGATIQDSRTEVSVSAARYGENTSAALTMTRSKEDDYEANALSLSGELTDDRALTTWSAGLSYSSDDVEPTDAAAFGRVRKEKRLSRSASLGVSRVIDRSSAVQAGLSVTEHSGYLSDPYKLRDVRPRGTAGMGRRRPLSALPRPCKCRIAHGLPLLHRRLGHRLAYAARLVVSERRRRRSDRSERSLLYPVRSRVLSPGLTISACRSI